GESPFAPNRARACVSHVGEHDEGPLVKTRCYPHGRCVKSRSFDPSAGPQCSHRTSPAFVLNVVAVRRSYSPSRVDGCSTAFQRPSMDSQRWWVRLILYRQLHIIEHTSRRTTMGMKLQYLTPLLAAGAAAVAIAAAPTAVAADQQSCPGTGPRNGRPSPPPG